jgi:hypothetical protein
MIEHMLNEMNQFCSNFLLRKYGLLARKKLTIYHHFACNCQASVCSATDLSILPAISRRLDGENITQGEGKSSQN